MEDETTNGVKHIVECKYEEGIKILEINSNQGLQLLKEVIQYHTNDEIAQRYKEQAIYKISQVLIEQGKNKELEALLASLNSFFLVIPKSKTGKIIRTIIDMVAKTKGFDSKIALELQEKLCLDSIEWCKKEKHTFLRQRIEARLCIVLFEQGKLRQGLELVTNLLRQIKKLDDKQLLVDLHLIESKFYHGLQNIPKSKAALTASRSICNAIYVTPKTQAQIDEMSGTLHAEEYDYDTAYSYFFEAFETLVQINDLLNALRSLKYMLLCKIANGSAEDVKSVLNSKTALKFIDIPDLQGLQAIAKANEESSLHLFDEAVEKFSSGLIDDLLIKRHLSRLYENLLEANLLKILLPFSCVEISHVAKLINLPQSRIEQKLSQMILDKTFNGILDQGNGHVIIYDSPVDDETYNSGLEVIDNVGDVVDSLFRRTEQLHV